MMFYVTKKTRQFPPERNEMFSKKFPLNSNLILSSQLQMALERFFSLDGQSSFLLGFSFIRTHQK